MVDGLLGLRHDVVIGSHDDDGNVGDLCTTGTHGGERLMTGCIKEGDMAAIGQGDVVCTDVLGDTTGLTCNHVGLSDIVEQRCLAMVHMAHHRDDGGTGLQVFLVVLHFIDSRTHFCAHVFCLEAKLVGNQVDGFCIHALVDADHDAHTHTGGYYLCDRNVHHRSQFVGCHKLGQLQHLAFCCFGLYFLLHAGTDGLALLTAVLGALAHLVRLVGEACQGLTHLLCHLFVAHLSGLYHLLGLVLLLLLVLAACLLVIAIALLAVLLAIAAVVATVLHLAGHGIHVDTLLAYALAFLLATALLAARLIAIAVFLFPLAALFLLALLLGACALVERRKVDMSLDRQSWSHLRVNIQAEHAIHLCTDGRFLLAWRHWFLFSHGIVIAGHRLFRSYHILRFHPCCFVCVCFHRFLH